MVEDDLSAQHGECSAPEERPVGDARMCEDCNVCCTMMYVRPLDKAAGTRCEHQTSEGCGIYATRPNVCREWYCMWVRDRLGVLRDEHRPDKLGVFFSVTTIDEKTQAQQINAHEVYPGASNKAEPKRIIDYFRQFVPVKVIGARNNGFIALTASAAAQVA